MSSSKEEEEKTCGASAHSDFGMLTLLATDGVPGLQVLAFISHNLLNKKDYFFFIVLTNAYILKRFAGIKIKSQMFGKMSLGLKGKLY